MSSLSYTIQDILSSFIGFCLFPVIYVFPGYVIAWLSDLFDFRSRHQGTRFVIAIVISFSVSPIITFLTWNLISVNLTYFTLALFSIAFIILIIKSQRNVISTEAKKIQLIAIWAAAGWSIFSILSLVDIQWGNRLYYNVVAYDFTTRAAIINAMTRTGVPPVNPSYFPGHPVYLTFLYYFWYIPCSLVDQLGGHWVDGRTAMIASVAWCGIGLMATIALYLRLRNTLNGIMAWKAGLVGSGLLLISGLDFIPAIILMISTRLSNGYSVLEGDIEHWNEQITAWAGAVTWVPHHVAGLIACITGIMLVHSARGKSKSRQFILMAIAGLAFASAAGLSIYITGVFVVFWGIWLVVIFLQKERSLGLAMAFAGIISLIAISPFLKGLFIGGTGATNNELPIAFAVRIFRPIVPYVFTYPSSILNIIFFLILPINYLFELGFFLVVGLLWIQQNKKRKWKINSFHLSEIILFNVTFLIGSFFRSTVIGSNDLGWRAWLFGQFILLIWGVDLIFNYFPNLKMRELVSIPYHDHTNWKSLRILLILGLLTTVIDLLLLRTWPFLVDLGVAGFPNSFSTDTNLGQRTFAAREAYEFINNHTSENVHIQQNPEDFLNRPIGLYANRPIAISGHTSYGISREDFSIHSAQVVKIFNTENNWIDIDQTCEENYINFISITDADPLWKSLGSLELSREPMYENHYYQIFECGDSLKP
jgi:hypothetical protein